MYIKYKKYYFQYYDHEYSELIEDEHKNYIFFDIRNAIKPN